MQLAHGDNDPVALLARVAAALERTGPVRGDLLEELSRRTPRIVEVALPLLAADLGERDPFVLVLDDVHLVTAMRSRSILGFLAEQVPSGSQLVLVTRGDPGLRLGRLRASGDLVEVGAALLALDTEETRAVAALGGWSCRRRRPRLYASGRRGGLRRSLWRRSRCETATMPPRGLPV